VVNFLAIDGSGGLTEVAHNSATDWVSSAFSTTVPLDGVYYMPRQIVGSGLAFAPAASPRPGGQCYVTVVADGAHTPTFSGFKELGSSSGYDNTLGIENQIVFWYDGTYSWYCVLQEVNAQPISATVLSSAIILTAHPDQIALTYGAIMSSSSVPATSAFSVSASGGAVSVSSVSIVSTVVTLQLSRTIDGAETVTVSYTVPGSNPLVSASGGVAAAALSGQTVTNSASTNTPSLQSATISGSSPNIIALLYQLNLDASSIPATSAFSVSASGGAVSVSSVGVSSATVSLTLSRPIVAGETVTVSYTVPGVNPVKAQSGPYYASALGSHGVNNNVSSSAVMRLATMVGVTETANVSFGYNYTSSIVDYSNNYGISSTKIPSGSDGFFGATFTVGSNGADLGPVFGVKLSGANGSFDGMKCAIYSDGRTYYRCVTNGGGQMEPDTQILAQSNDVVRLRRSGTSLIAEVSKDAGSTYSTAKTWADITGDLYLNMVVTSRSGVNSVFSSGNVS
jgi:uncharacterized repeat protein (TIGR02059 family)